MPPSLRGSTPALSSFPPPPTSTALVFLPAPSLPVELLCVALYALLAALAGYKALAAAPHAASAYEARRRHSFQQLLALFSVARALSFLAHGVARDLLHRLALCLFFSLALFQVLFWIDIANPKVSVRSRRLWRAFTVANGVFYALVLGLSLLHAWRANSADSDSVLLTDVVPVLLIAAGSLASALGLVYSTCKMRRRVGRVLRQSTDGPRRRRLDERVEAKLQRALSLTLLVMRVCSVVFLLRTLLYLQRPFSHRGCGAIDDATVCVLVGYALPELVPSVLFLLLMWEVEPDLQFPSRRRPSFNGLALSESTPLLFDDQLPALSITATPVSVPSDGTLLPASTNVSSSKGQRSAAQRVTSRRSSPLSFGLGGNVLEQARRRLELGAQSDTSGGGGNDSFGHHALHLRDARLVSSSNNVLNERSSSAAASAAKTMKRSTSAYAALPSTEEAQATADTSLSSVTLSAGAAHAWLSFQCFNLNLPSSSDATSSSSFLVLQVLDADTSAVVVDIGRSEVSTSEDPCFHLMLPVEMREHDLLRIAVYSVRSVQSIDDLKSQWLVGDALVPLASFVAGGKFAFGRAALHALFSPLSRSRSSGEVVVRCEAEVKSVSGVSDEGRQRITRAFMYFSADESDALLHHETRLEPPPPSLGRRQSDVATTLQHSHAKVLVEEEVIESVYTWEIPYQLLQLILSDLVVKLDALKRETLADEPLGTTSRCSTPGSQVSSRGTSIMPPPLSTSPGALSIVPESDGDESLASSDDESKDDFAASPLSQESARRRDRASELAPDVRRQAAPSIGMLSELIFQIQDDSMERKKRKWRHELVATMEQYISQVEDAILRYGDTHHAGLTFKPSTMKADADLCFLALNLHQQLLTVGTAVPTSPSDVIYGGNASRGVRYARLVDTFVDMIVVSPAHTVGDSVVDHIATIHDLDNEKHHHVDGSADSDGESDNVESRPDMASSSLSSPSKREPDEAPVEPVEALRRRVISFDSAETIVSMSASGRDVAVPHEQRKLAETIVALGISERDVKQATDEDEGTRTAESQSNSRSREPPSRPTSGQRRQGIAEWMKRKWREVEVTLDEKHHATPTTPFEHHCMYGTTTVGAFAAHVYGFKNGGIRQMRTELERIHSHLVREAEKASTDLTLEALERKYHELKWHIERRLEVAFCQAMSALVTCFQQTLYSHVHDDREFGVHRVQVGALDYVEMISEIGFLFSVESLLSTYSNEAGMLGDMDAAVKELARVLIKLRPVETPLKADFRVSVTSGPLGIVIELPIIVCDARAYPDRNMHRVPGQDAFTGAVYCPLTSSEEIDRAKRVFRRTIRVKTVLFSQGMNEMQTVANTVGRDALQREINAENVVVLENYFLSFEHWCKKRARSTDRSARSVPPAFTLDEWTRLHALVDRLKTNIQLSGRSKRMAILSLSSLIARSIGGGRVTCCKSAKDRTAMSITLEEANLLVLSHGLNSDERPLLTSLLRTYGVRRENARKNIGKAQYCFSALQNYMLPEEYQCPPGTGGGSHSLA